VVFDHDEREVARASGAFGTSVCDPGERQATEFSFDLAPGVYRVAFAVRDASGGCGLHRTFEDLSAVSAALSVSDIVITCGLPERDLASSKVRLDPDLSARVQGSRPLLAYFEVYHLHTEAGDGNRFQYQYSVYTLDRTLEGTRPLLSFHSEQEGVGTMRRQFISVPVAALRPGRYRLSIVVRDLRSGAEAGASTEFLKIDTAGTPAALSKP
jgi:hypothetical protein